MTKKQSQATLIKNEQILRRSNIKFKDGIKKYFRNDKAVVETPIDFVCECSVLNCKKHVRLSVSAYEKLHEKKNRFTVARGHVTPEVEKLVSQKPKLEVVEKPQLKP